MALVPTARAADARPEGSLVLYDGVDSLGPPLEQKLARLRGDREAHSRKQIWTKDAHGGPYRKVNENKGYDALIQLPDGTERKVDLGYERVKVGPTSNFVGNHMTQGAIDLVQAQLEQPAAPPQLLLPLLEDAAAGEHRAVAPQLLYVAAAAGLAAEETGPALRQRQLQLYRWADAGSAVTVEVPVAQMLVQELSGSGSSNGSGSSSTGCVSCTIRASSLDLIVTLGCQAGAGGGGAVSGGRSQAVSYLLAVHPLHAAVVPGRCRCYLRGLAALPPSGGAQTAGSLEAAPASEAAPPSEAPQEQQTISFILPPTVEAIVVQLAKADGQLGWEALQASAPLAVAPSRCGGKAGQPDLAALRKAVRQQLGRAPSAQGAPRDAGTKPTLQPCPPLSASNALAAAEALVATGQHADALVLLQAAPLAQQEGEQVQVQVQVEVLALAAHCHVQLGCLREAEADYTAAIQLAAAAAERQAQLCELLLARATLYEQLEQAQAALADVARAGRLQQALPPAALLAADRLSRACGRGKWIPGGSPGGAGQHYV